MLTLLISCTTTDDERDYKLKELVVAIPAHVEMAKKRQMKPPKEIFFFDLPDDKLEMLDIAKMMRDGSKRIKEFVDKEMNP